MSTAKSRNHPQHRMASKLYTTFLIPTLLILLCGCATSPSARFARTFQRAYDTGNTNALLALVEWDGMPEALSSAMVWKLTDRIGEERIASTVWTAFDSHPIVPSNHDGRKLLANLQPKFWLGVTTACNSNSASITVRDFLVGSKNKKLYICGFRFEQP